MNPPPSLIMLHKAAQQARPFIAALHSLDHVNAALKIAALNAISTCDAAMMSADDEYPEFDFYNQTFDFDQQED